MKLELILPFLISLLITVKSEAQANIFAVLENALVSTTMEATTVTEEPIIDITKGWFQEIIDTVGLCDSLQSCLELYVAVYVVVLEHFVMSKEEEVVIHHFMNIIKV